MRLFIRSKAKYGGDIAVLGLSDWWHIAFTDQERDVIRHRYDPYGVAIGVGGNQRRLIDQGSVISTTDTAARFLVGLASWFDDRQFDRIHYIILTEAEKRATKPFEKHMAYTVLIQYWYRLRDDRAGARDQAIAYCQRQIAISKDAAKAWRKEFKHGMPEHLGFKQLAIIREKDGEFAEALRLSEQAKKDGWSGDWDKRIARLKKRAATPS